MTRITVCILLVPIAAGISKPVAHAQDDLTPPDSAPAETSGADAVDRLFSILREEPTIREVQRRTLDYYQLSPERVRRVVRSARLKGLIPTIEGNYEAVDSDNFSNTLDGLYPILPDVPENPNPNNYRERVTGGQVQNIFRLRAIFNLHQLVFNAESLDARSLNSMGENLVREVTTLYFTRRRLIAGLILQPPQTDLELFSELMRLDELTATLDALTGGYFADHAWNWNENENQNQ